MNRDSPTSRATTKPVAREDGSAAGKTQFLPGVVLAQRYRMIESLGRGGMGEVFRADDLKLGHSVALKFLSPELAQDAEAMTRLRREVRIARRIVRCYLQPPGSMRRRLP